MDETSLEDKRLSYLLRDDLLGGQSQVHSEDMVPGGDRDGDTVKRLSSRTFCWAGGGDAECVSTHRAAM